MDESVQESLTRLAGTSEAERVLWEHFLRVARNYAATLMSIDTKRFSSPTSVAGAALHSAISKAKQCQQSLDENGFRALLCRIVRNKVADAARKATAQCRAGGTALPEGECVDPAGDPLQEVIIREQAERVIEWVLAEPDERKRLILYLGIVDAKSTEDIYQVLSALETTHTTDFTCPAPRTIQVVLQTGKATLCALLADEE